MATLPDIAIILVNWNTCELLVDCLAALPAAVGSLVADVWVVDNHSTDDSVITVRRRFPHVQVIANERNVGFAAANNQAIHASRGRHVLLLNSDTVALPGSLSALVRFLDRHAQVGIVGAQLRNADGSLQPSWAAFPTIWSELLGKNFRARRAYATSDGSVAYRVDWVGGACLCIRRTAVDQIGLLDERFFMYSEETDWCYRARQQGWDVCYYPAAQVVHFGGQSSRHASLPMRQQLYRSKLRFFARHYGLQRAYLLGSLLQIGFVVKSHLRHGMASTRHNSSAGHGAPDDRLALARAVGWELLRLSGRLGTRSQSE